MQSKRLPILVFVILAAVLIAAGYFAYTTLRPFKSSALAASGTVEATEITLAPELAGKVKEVLVKEGDMVKAGDVLFSLDDAMLKAQRAAASAALETAQAAARTADASVASAQAQYNLALSAALVEQKASRSADWTATKPNEYNQPVWYFEKTEQLSSALIQETEAQVTLDAARSKLKVVEEKAASGNFIDTEKRLMLARSAFEVAQNVLSSSAKSGQDIKDSAQRTYDEALSELKNAQTSYDLSATSSGAKDVLTSRADLRVAQEGLDAAQDKVRTLQTGSDSPKVGAAQKALDLAAAAAAQAKTAVASAQANLAVLDTQIAKLSVTSPSDGVILTRSIEPGEVVMPGSSLLTMARLSDLTITVFVPENRYGELSLGQSAVVTVDSFPGETFTGSVANISNRAEFTPRNVQTASGRTSTVFAIKLSLPASDGKLKPGMPADVSFK